MAEASISLDDLIALNLEIAALARAGAPLESGLRSFAGETPGRLGQVARALSERLAQGQSLDSAALPGVPPLYVAVVEAGVRAGRLSAALEGLAEMAQRLAQLRRTLSLSLLYPVTVLLTTYFLLLFFLTVTAPTLARSMEDTGISMTGFFATLAEAGEWLKHWWWAPPLALVIAALVWWRQTARSLVLQPRLGMRWLGWMPWFGKLQRYSQLTVFTKTLALLIENKRPLPEAALLAARATGDERLERRQREWITAVESGAPPSAALRRAGLPPLLGWLLGGSTQQIDLAGNLHQLAEDYQQRATNQAEKMRVFVPLLLTAGVAVSAVALYALMLFWPWSTALRELAAP